MERSWFVAAVVSFGLLGACGSDGGSGSSSGSGGSSNSGTLSCDATCPAVLAPKCANGPVSQSDCVQGCTTVRSGPCAAEYEALAKCGGSNPKYDCTSQGQPGIIGCDAETTALWSCVFGS